MNPRLRRKLIKMCKEYSATIDDRLAERAARAARIAERQEDGKIVVVHGGIDCDGGRWDDCCRTLPAIPRAVEKWIDDYYDGAEGPQWFYLSRPSDARDLEPSSRDLAMEAFENGHPHIIRI